MQEAKDSSAIENIITTRDELFRADAALDKFDSPGSKEVHDYAAALRVGFERVRKQGFLRLDDILAVQEALIKNRAGLRWFSMGFWTSHYLISAGISFGRKPDIPKASSPLGSRESWDEWILYMLKAVEVTSQETLERVAGIRKLMLETRRKLRTDYSKIYSLDLLNNLFRHPFTKIEFIERDLGVSRQTATKYLDELAKGGIIRKMKMGRANFYVNDPLFNLLGR